MKKILTLILVLALIMAIPPLRMRLGAASVPLLERLGPVGAGLLDPARRMGARARTSAIMNMLLNEREEGREPPSERNFQAWLQRADEGETGLDPWGRPYWLGRERSVLIVGSSGPDRQRGTEDDITQRSTP